MTIQPISLAVISIIVLLSMMFIGPLYIAFISLALAIYTIITMVNVENDLVNNTIVDISNNTIMTRSRKRLQEQSRTQS